MRARFDFLADGDPVLFERPRQVLMARTVADVAPVMAAADRALRDGFHIAGWVAYEAAAAFDASLVTHTRGAVPLVCFGVFEEKRQAPPLDPSAHSAAPLKWTPALTPEQHAKGVAAIREAIADGETYQINYTFRLNADLPDLATTNSLYAALASVERVPYAACIETGDWSVLSLSPELFFRRDGDRLITKPMKGTAPRGRWRAEDLALAHALQTSEKNRAENVMIVDLCRNDLTRVCRGGTVAATSLFDVERYPTVWQMVSTVEGRLADGTQLTDIFAALFPAGSITGAPKSSSMRLIASLEHAPRGVYCGSLGYASPDGRATFNVAIRTMTVHRPSGRAEYGVGGGITWDSTAPDEHAEAMQKAACLEVRPPFSLIETLRWENGEYVRLDAHLARLKESADYFGFTTASEAHSSDAYSSEAPGFSPALFARAEARALHPNEPQRVRLELAPDGHLSMAFAPLDIAPEAPTFVLASSPVGSSSRWLFHKTTRREVYDSHRAEHPGVFDVLLWNERQELTEFTRGNVVIELDGRLVTPPRACGLLGGVFRQALLDSGTVVETVVAVADLERASRLWFVNSLREWVQVRRVTL